MFGFWMQVRMVAGGCSVFMYTFVIRFITVFWRLCHIESECVCVDMSKSKDQWMVTQASGTFTVNTEGVDWRKTCQSFF